MMAISNVNENNIWSGIAARAARGCSWLQAAANAKWSGSYRRISRRETAEGGVAASNLFSDIRDQKALSK